MSIPSENVIIQAIAHDIRRGILRIVNKEPRTFTDLLQYFDISTGKLNYHLNQIKGFIARNDETIKYEITSLGKKALKILDVINREIPETDQPLLKEAFLSQKEIGKPLVLQGINIGIGMICFIMIIHAFLAVIALTDPNIPFFILPLLLTLLLGEFGILIWLIRVKIAAPVFIERFTKHIRDTEP